jgi:TctA family transporter
LTFQYFSLFVFALSIVAGLTGASLTRGLLSGASGLVIT